MSAESGKAPNIVQVIRAAVDRLPDSEAAQLDEAAKTVAALVEALKALRLAREQDKYPSWEKGVPDFNEAEAMADAALRAAGEGP